MGKNKRLFVLLGILAILSGVLGMQQMGIVPISVGENTASAGTQGKPTITKEKIQVDKLAVNKQSLKSENNKNPFNNPLKENVSNNNRNNQTTTNRTNKPKTNVSMTPVMNPRNASNTQNQSHFKVKAIAASGDNMIAVIEDGGKVVSANVGSTVGDYIVTNITKDTVEIEGLKGDNMVLSMR